VQDRVQPPRPGAPTAEQHGAATELYGARGGGGGAAEGVRQWRAEAARRQGEAEQADRAMLGPEAWEQMQPRARRSKPGGQ
jgi:hypothetical protein